MENSTKITGSIELIKQSLVFYRQHFLSIISFFIIWAALSVLGGLTVNPLVAILLSIVLFIVSFVVQIAFMGYVVSGGVMLVSDALKRALILFLPFVWLAIVSALAILGGMVLLVIPGIALSIWLTLSGFVLVDSDKRGFKALLESWRLTSGYWWAVVGRLLIAGLVVLVVGLALGLILTALPFGQQLPQIITAIVDLLVLSPLATIYLSLIYRDLKILKSSAAAESSDLTKKRKWLTAFAVIGLIFVVLVIIISISGLIFLLKLLLNQSQTNSVLNPAAAGLLPLRLWLN